VGPAVGLFRRGLLTEEETTGLRRTTLEGEGTSENGEEGLDEILKKWKYRGMGRAIGNTLEPFDLNREEGGH